MNASDGLGGRSHIREVGKTKAQIFIFQDIFLLHMSSDNGKDNVIGPLVQACRVLRALACGGR